MAATGRARGAAAVAAAALAVTLVPAAPAAAGDEGVMASGRCSERGTWKLKAKHDDGRIEVEFEVDVNRNGKKYAVRIRDNGVLRFSGTRVTQPPSGSFTVERRIPNMKGSDRIVAVARNAFGNTCRGVVTL